MLDHEFIRLALLAGTPIALACGVVGYLVVLRSEVFAGDALSHVAFTGALAAAAAGLEARAGLFAATVIVAGAMGVLGRRARADDVVIGTVFAWILGLGALFLSIFTTSRSADNGIGGVRVLFGSIFGLSASQAWVAATVAALVVVALLLMARPLLITSLDFAAAEARGIPVRVLGTAFLALLGLTVAEGAQVVGALLLLGLLAAPAGAAHRLAANPYLGLALSGALAVASLWVGLVVAYAVPSLPPSSAIVGVAAAAYVLASIYPRRGPTRGMTGERAGADS